MSQQNKGLCYRHNGDRIPRLEHMAAIDLHAGQNERRVLSKIDIAPGRNGYRRARAT